MHARARRPIARLGRATPRSSRRSGRIFPDFSPSQKGRPEGRFHLLQQTRQGARLEPRRARPRRWLSRPLCSGRERERPGRAAARPAPGAPRFAARRRARWIRPDVNRRGSLHQGESRCPDARCHPPRTERRAGAPLHPLPISPSEMSTTQQTKRLGNQGARFWAEMWPSGVRRKIASGAGQAPSSSKIRT